MKNRSRLADVAKLAGVSTATVSAVINHSTGGNIRVSAETRQRVLETRWHPSQVTWDDPDRPG